MGEKDMLQEKALGKRLVLVFALVFILQLVVLVSFVSADSAVGCSDGCVDGGCVDKCETDQDCPKDFYSEEDCLDDDVVIYFHDFFCKCSGYCDEEVTTIVIEECDFGCSDGGCLDIACCENSDCGTDGLLGILYCKQGNVYDTFLSFICENPGTPQSYCSNNTEPVLIEVCVFGCNEGECKEECDEDEDCGFPSSGLICVDNNVVNRTKTPICVDGKCDTLISDEIIEECDSDERCDDGECEKKKKRRKEPRIEEFDESVKIPDNITRASNYTLLEESLPETIELAPQPAAKTVINPFIWILLIILIVLIIILVIVIIVVSG
jgi:hypothetical protein